MSETARPGDADAVDSSLIPSLGVVPASVAMAAVFVPLRRGVDDPVVWTAAALAVVTVTTFLARRHGALDRRVGGPVAAGSSLLVALLSGYALNQGTAGAIVVPSVEWTISMLLLAFAAAIGAVSIGVADYAAISERGLKRRLVRSTEMVILGFVGLFSMTLASIVVMLPLLALGASLTDFLLQIVQYLSTALGFGSVAIAYLLWRGDGVSYIDLEVPTVRSIGWTIGGLALLFGVLIGISILLSVVGVDTAEHGTTQQVEQNPELLLIVVPAMLLIVGPFEELLYRNVVQKSLYTVFSRYGAIAVTSVIFASVHVIAYATSGSGQVLASLFVLFGLSLVLGFVYERTDNLLVPAVVHGCFNAVQMAMIHVV